MLDTVQHEIILRNILHDIYQDIQLSTKLAFKGGTCLYFFYDLPRFSVDLDFNQLQDFNLEKITQIADQYLTIEDFHRHTKSLFWLGSYEKGKQKVKIEIGQRDYPDQYMTHNFFGVSIKTMEPEYMLAHKLCAITDRKQLRNKDLLDTWFMLKNRFNLNQEIIELRTGKSTATYLEDIQNLIRKLGPNDKSLADLGEIVSVNQKNWTHDHLLEELVFELDNKILELKSRENEVR